MYNSEDEVDEHIRLYFSTFVLFTFSFLFYYLLALTTLLPDTFLFSFFFFFGYLRYQDDMVETNTDR